jgi:hypothetical protein
MEDQVCEVELEESDALNSDATTTAVTDAGINESKVHRRIRAAEQQWAQTGVPSLIVVPQGGVVGASMEENVAIYEPLRAFYFHMDSLFYQGKYHECISECERWFVENNGRHNRRIQDTLQAARKRAAEMDHTASSEPSDTCS